MTFTKNLLNKTESLWKNYLAHPFLVELCNGSLPKEKFKYYLIQDYLYLKEYAKVFCMGVIKSTSIKDMRFFYNAVNGTMNDETAIHIEYMRKLGVEPLDAEKKDYDLTTISYTSYMQSICLTGSLKEIAVATLSCTLSYSYICKQLEKMYKDKLVDNYYSSWIYMYTDDSFTKFSDDWVKYIDNICSDITKEEKEKLEDIFIKCSIYEMQFWDMAYKER